MGFFPRGHEGLAEKNAFLLKISAIIAWNEDFIADFGGENGENIGFLRQDGSYGLMKGQIWQRKWGKMLFSPPGDFSGGNNE